MTRLRHVPTLVLLAVLVGCVQKQSPQQLKEETAEATATAKNDAKAVAEGIREGWDRNRPLDLNTATREQLVSLPGINGAEAERVIAGRPYNQPGDLVVRRILSKTEYDRIADRITAKR